MDITESDPTIAGREFIFATYTRSSNKEDDALIVKEHLHMSDGSIKKNLRVVKNYQRTFYTTKKSLQTHKDKREFEYLYNLDEHHCTQAQLPKAIYKALNGYYSRSYVKISEMNESPYLYGSFVTTPVLLAHDYKVQWPDLVSDWDLAVMDFETDELNGTKYIISGVLSYKDKVHISVTRDFLAEHAATAKEEIIAALNTYLGEYIKARNITPTIHIVDNSAEVAISCIRKAHLWQPDIVGFWNISFDIPKVIEALDRHGYDPAYIFSDPNIPAEFRYFNWHKVDLKKLTVDGKKSLKRNEDVIHDVSAPCGFKFLCLMALFKLVRAQKEQKRNSYALDPILDAEVKLSKLRFDGIAEGLIKLDWHREMQKNHKIPYMVYMVFDGIAVELLDDKTADVRKSLKSLVGISEISKLTSNPKRMSDDLHFILLAEGKVSCTPGKSMSNELDELTPSKNGWVKIA